MPAEQRRQVQRRNDSRYRRGILLVLGGIAAVPRPRPGWLIVSLSRVTSEFEPIARPINWLEVRLRRLALGPRRLGEIAIVVKVLVILTILPCFAALGYGTYYLFFGG